MKLIFTTGPWRPIKNLWAYVVISQILPVSFSQNLFYLALLLKDTSKANPRFWTPNVLVMTAPLYLFAVLVYLAPGLVESQYFLAVVAVIRLLLFWPLIAATALPSLVGSYQTSAVARQTKLVVLIHIAVLMLVVLAIQTRSILASGSSGFGRMLSAINDDSSVSALGYDYLLSLISSVAWHQFADDPSAPILPKKKQATA